ncbi:FAD-dependent oxidoreductase [Candidatus Albibeggiatoa sp. nov. NOAA]|uniref:protoporphyrinogen/coproporphyrinogen oxidase n=1 Tax=Candidatus Albibeggiatoa sp. nov. NOAA TaxID=3162724 RepID=UPI0032F47181|nr:FAD-dependent oxidoreductase [Thiotrichaceae bacterium]
MSEQQYDMLIIGAGISGLSMAHYCTQHGLKTLVLEKENRNGGLFHSHQFGSQYDDFWIELGTHSCFNSYGHIIKLIEDYGLIDTLTQKQSLRFKLWNGRQINSIPSQLNYFELLFSVPKLFFLKKQGKSIQEYYGSIVGKRNYQNVFSPAFNGVICQPSDNFPANMLFRKKPRRKDVIRNFTFEHGIQALPEKMGATLDVKNSITVENIEYDGQTYQVAANGQTYESRYLTLATPVNVTADLTETIAPNVHEALKVVNHVSIETIGVMLDKQVMDLKPLGGIIGQQDKFYSVVSRDAVEHSRYRGFTFHFKPNTFNNDEKLEYLCGVLQVEKNQIQDIVTKQNYLPAPVIGHQQTLEKLATALDKQPLFITGNYFYGVSAEDCVTRSVDEFNRLEQLMNT